MKNNQFWQMAAKGGKLPEKFDLNEWRQAWKKSIVNLNIAIDQFKSLPNWSNYWNLGSQLAKSLVLREVITHIPMFLGGCSAEARMKAEHGAIEEIEQILLGCRDDIYDFMLKAVYSGDKKTQATARREYLYWTGISPRKADCLRIEKETPKEGRPIHFARLEMEHVSFLKGRYRQKAREAGFYGYLVDPKDYEAEVLLSVQNEESIRKELWESIQQNSTNEAEASRMLQARKEWARDGDCDNYSDYLSRLSPGLSFNTVSKHMVSQLKEISPTYNKLNDYLITKGLTRSHWQPEKQDDIHLPWNSSYLQVEATEGELPLNGREFPLKRVLNYIIPDLISMGGWKVIGKPEKIGRGKNCLYLYKLHNNNKLASLYFAPYPHNEVKSSDAYQAYATILRERWTGGKPTTPMVLVAQNLSLCNGCLTDIEQLTYLAHELGHALHFVSLEGQVFDEFNRTPYNITELPSILMEQVTKDPETLRKWSNPKASSSIRKLSYWQRRVVEPSYSLIDYVTQIESAWLDIAAHSEDPETNLCELRNDLRKKVGLGALHEDDKGAYRMFDMTEQAGISNIYIVGRALSKALIGKKTTYANISKAMQFLINNILCCSSEKNIHRKWQEVYQMSLYEMFKLGFEKLGEQHIKRAKKAMNRKKDY